MQVEKICFQSAAAVGSPIQLNLVASLFLPDCAGVTPGLIVGHGAGSNRLNHGEFCLAACSAGFTVLALDFRGHGESEGEVDGPLELDLIAAAGWLRSQTGVDSGSICYRGSSMGGFYGLKAAPEANFAAMVLLCPASETIILEALERAQDAAEQATDKPVATGGCWNVKSTKEYFEHQQSYALAAKVRCPTFLIHVRGDEVVPFTHTLMIVRSLRTDTTLLALQDGSHTTAQHDPRIHRRSIEWLQQQLTSYSGRI